MVWGSLKALAKRATDTADDLLGKYTADRDFLEAAMAGAVVMMFADRQASAAERDKLGLFITRHQSMKHFSKDDALALFHRYASEVDFSYEMACDTCLKELADISDPSKARVIGHLVLVLANSDGEFSAGEQRAFGRICDALRIDSASF